MKLRLIGVRLSNLKDMREPEKGSLKGMFEKTSKSPQKRTSKSDEEEGEEQDDIDIAIQCSLKDELETMQRGEESLFERKEQLSVECPVCQQLVHCQGSADQLNVRLNQHMDRCLNIQTPSPEPMLAPATKGAPLPAPQKEKRKAGPMDLFVQRKVKQY